MAAQSTSLIDRGILNEFKTCRSFRVFSLLTLATIVLAAAAAVLCVMRGYKTNAATVLFYCGLGMCLVEMATWNLFFNAKRQTPFGFSCGRLFAKLAIAAIVLGVVLDGLTLLSFRATSPSPLAFTNIARCGILVVLSYVGMLAIAYQRPGFIKNVWRRIAQNGSLLLVGKIILCVIIVLVAGIACGYFVSQTYGLAFFSTAFFGVSVFAVIGAFFMLRKVAGKHPEWLFLVVSLAFGCFLCVCIPVETIVSWDDSSHFRGASGLSYVGNSERNDAYLSLELPGVILDSVGDLPISEYSQTAIDDYTNRLNAAYETGEASIVSGFNDAANGSYLNLVSVGYIPAAIGLWLGRVLGLSFSAFFVLGRLLSLLCYTLVCFFAIRLIPVRKVVLGVCALLPELVFLASMYSYDYWLNAFTLLGVALVVRELVEKDKVISPKSWLGICLCFMLAIMVKLIYFPLFGLLFLLPKTKFSSKKHRVLVYASAVGAILLLAATFLVPFVVTTSGPAVSGDVRGGSDVNAGGQVAFVLTQPLAYAKILGSFLVTSFLSISGVEELSSLFAYFGRLSDSFPFLTGITTLLLFSAALTDCDERSAALCKKGNIIWTAIIIMGTVIMIASALYVDYTPVGLETINGCQPRYLLPLLFPLFALVINPKMKLLGKSSAHALIFYAAVAAFNALCCWTLVGSIILA